MQTTLPSLHDSLDRFDIVKYKFNLVLLLLLLMQLRKNINTSSASNRRNEFIIHLDKNEVWKTEG